MLLVIHFDIPSIEGRKEGGGGGEREGGKREGRRFGFARVVYITSNLPQFRLGGTESSCQMPGRVVR